MQSGFTRPINITIRRGTIGYEHIILNTQAGQMNPNKCSKAVCVWMRRRKEYCGIWMTSRANEHGKDERSAMSHERGDTGTLNWAIRSTTARRVNEGTRV